MQAEEPSCSTSTGPPTLTRSEGKEQQQGQVAATGAVAAVAVPRAPDKEGVAAAQRLILSLLCQGDD